jgi:protein-tyrosine phosphatase
MPVKILMVCLGNICRSPLAEGLLASKLPKDKFIVDSAGTGHWHVGKQPDQRSIDTARKNGVDISRQKGRLFTSDDFDNFDYIYVMDSSNYSDVLEFAKTDEQRAKVRLILDELFPGEKVDVPDPYFGLENGFDIVYRMLDETCEVIAKKLTEKHTDET